MQVSDLIAIQHLAIPSLFALARPEGVAAVAALPSMIFTATPLHVGVPTIIAPQHGYR